MRTPTAIFALFLICVFAVWAAYTWPAIVMVVSSLATVTMAIYAAKLYEVNNDLKVLAEAQHYPSIHLDYYNFEPLSHPENKANLQFGFQLKNAGPGVAYNVNVVPRIGDRPPFPVHPLESI